MKSVLFAPEVEEDLFELTKILVDKQYLANADYAITNNHVNGQYFNQ